MKVLLVHGRSGSALGGADLYVEALACVLARTHDVAVLSAARSGPATVPRDGADPVRRMTVPPTESGFESGADSRAATAAGEAIARFRPDVVHVHSLAGLSAGLVHHARDAGAATVVTLHDFWPVCPLGQLLDRQWRTCAGPTPRRCLGCVGEQVLVPPAWVARARRGGDAGPVNGGEPRRRPRGGTAGPAWALALARAASRLVPAAPPRVAARADAMREALRAADHVLAPSAFLRDRLGALGIRGIEVLPLGHEPLVPRARSADPQGRVRFGFIGAAIPSKGVHVLAEAWRRLGDRRATLAIHGAFADYHGDATYEARVRALLGAEGEPALRGGFTPDALPDVLAGLDVVVVPSLWEENAPRVVEEAFLARRPLVVSDHGGLAERVREGIDGLRFRPGDATDLARVLRVLIEDDGLRQRLGQSPPHVPTLPAHVEALEEVYRRAGRRRQARTGRVGVVVLDRGRPADTAAAVASAVGGDVSAHVVVVHNGPGPEGPLPASVERLRLPRNSGYGAGMNAGARRLRAAGCDRLLLLNNDAVLAPGALRRLAEALEDASVGAAAPVVLRADGRIEARGATCGRGWGRVRLLGHGDLRRAEEGRLAAQVLPGAAWMVRGQAFDAVGGLDEEYFYSFEETDWCLRATAQGWRLEVVLGATAVHGGSRTIGADSAARLYYAARNHLRFDRLRLAGASSALRGAARRSFIVCLNLVHALRQGRTARLAAARAVLRGHRDFLRGTFGPEGGLR